MTGRACKCLICGHVWVTGLAHDPKQCPACKRKDWSGLCNSYGRPLVAAPVAVPGGCTCAACGASWAAGVTVAACPFCGATLGGAAAPVAVKGVPCSCRWCGGSWVSRSAETVPNQCPKCKKTKWTAPDPFDPDGLFEPGRCECRKCGNAWVSKVAEGLPLQCPKCKTRDWSPEATAAAIYALENPEWVDCERRNVMTTAGPLGDPVTGIHRFIDTAKTGYCPLCGWNNNLRVQVGINHPPKLTEEEKARRIFEWEMAHPGEKW